jgi:anti-anti-sigma factor
MAVSTQPPVHNEATGSIHVALAADTVAALELEGEFDLATAAELTEHADRVLAQGKHLIVDFTDTTFIDSSIVHALFKVDRAVKHQGLGYVVQLATGSNIERVLELTGATKQLVIARTRPEAIDLIYPPARISLRDRAGQS